MSRSKIRDTILVYAALNIPSGFRSGHLIRWMEASGRFKHVNHANVTTKLKSMTDAGELVREARPDAGGTYLYNLPGMVE